jgi:hypothetical protein
MAMKILTSVMALTFAAPLASGEGFPPLRLVGDETIATKVKASPRDYFGKPLVMTGLIEISDLYIAKYGNADETHFSLAFRQVLSDPPQAMGEHVTVFLQRGDTARRIVERIITRSKLPGSMTPIRVKATLDPARYKVGSWDLLELLDVQFPTADLRDWGPWIIETENRRTPEETAVLVEQR